MTYSQEMEAALRKVGEYLYKFSLAEVSLNDCIAKALDVSSDQADAIGGLVQLRNKLRLLKDAIILQSNKDKAWVDAAIQTFNALDKTADDRNIVAHNTFVGMTNGDIVFRKRAIISNPVTAPSYSITWTDQEYIDKCQKMDDLKTGLEKIAKDLQPVIHLLTATITSNASLIGHLTVVPSASTSHTAVTSQRPDPDP